MRHVYAVLAALPSAAIAATFLVTWFSPTAFGERMLSDLLCLMMLEFVLMHAGVFMSLFPTMAKTRGGKIAVLLGFTLLYSVFAIGMALSWDAPWLIVDFAVLVAGKLMAVRHLEDKQRQMVAIISSGTGIAFFILFVAGAVFCPFPQFGVEATYVRPPGGDKFPNPERIIGAGFCYWTAHAVTQFLLQRRMRPAAPRTPGPQPVIFDVETREPVDIA